MAGQSRRWLILVATVWIQAFTGTNFDFSAYSSALKSVLGISQVQLNYLAVASDMGKVFGWSSGLALKHLPLSVVLFISAFMGFVGYGLQWLVIREVLTLPYFAVLLLCLLAGCSICWFNTVCFVLCIRNFPSSSRPLAISLTVSFNGVSAALYTLAAAALRPSSPPMYLILNALLPLLVSAAALPPILLQTPPDILSDHSPVADPLVFLLLNALAALTGAYLLLSSSVPAAPALLFSGAVLLLALPLIVPGVVYARDCLRRLADRGSGFILVDVEELELHKELLSSGHRDAAAAASTVMGKDRLAMLGEEHSAGGVVRRVDFWLYYVAYFCGGTIGLVFSNNLGQIAQSLGMASKTATLVTLYSSFSFFGRLLSAAPDYIRSKFYFARTGWMTIALIPTPIAFFLLAASGAPAALHAGTALVGLSSGFIFAAAVSITSELFGPNSVSVNHNILITNIPIGSLAYGLLAALVYDANSGSSSGGRNAVVSDTVVCMGRQCYFLTFVLWGCISVVGLVSSFFLFLRTRHAYDHFEHSRIMQLY